MVESSIAHVEMFASFDSAIDRCGESSLLPFTEGLHRGFLCSHQASTCSHPSTYRILCLPIGVCSYMMQMRPPIIACDAVRCWLSERSRLKQMLGDAAPRHPQILVRCVLSHPQGSKTNTGDCFLRCNLSIVHEHEALRLFGSTEGLRVV